MNEKEIDSLDWCNKCVNHVRKTRATITKKSLEVLFGANAENMTIHCTRCSITFQESFQKRIDQIECHDCSIRDWEQLEQQRRVQEEIQFRINEERSRQMIFRYPKQQFVPGPQSCAFEAYNNV